MKNIYAQWKALAAEKKITHRDVAAFCIYRSLNKQGDVDATRTAIMQGYGKEAAKKRLRKSFSPITNKTKLINGSTPFRTLIESLRTVKYSVIVGWLDQDDARLILDMAAELSKEGLE